MSHCGNFSRGTNVLNSIRGITKLLFQWREARVCAICGWQSFEKWLEASLRIKINERKTSKWDFSVFLWLSFSIDGCQLCVCQESLTVDSKNEAWILLGIASNWQFWAMFLLESISATLFQANEIWHLSIHEFIQRTANAKSGECAVCHAKCTCTRNVVTCTG